MNKDPNKIYVGWSWRDIESVQEDWTEEQCKKALKLIGEDLTDHMILIGNTAIELLTNKIKDKIESE